jgi:hypothetical protein
MYTLDKVAQYILQRIKYHVPSNATQTMYNIQFILLKSQPVSTILSGHHQLNTV